MIYCCMTNFSMLRFSMFKRYWLISSLRISEAIRDENLTEAIIYLDDRWVIHSQSESESSHEEFWQTQDVYNILYHMRKDEKRFMITLIQQKTQCVEKKKQSDMWWDVNSLNHYFMITNRYNNVVHLTNIIHEDHKRRFYYSKILLKAFDACLLRLNCMLNQRCLEVKEDRFEAVIIIDITKLSLVFMHQLLDQMLIIFSTYLMTRKWIKWIHKTSFISIAAEILEKRDADQRNIFSTFVQEWDLEELVKKVVREKWLSAVKHSK